MQAARARAIAHPPSPNWALSPTMKLASATFKGLIGNSASSTTRTQHCCLSAASNRGQLTSSGAGKSVGWYLPHAARCVSVVLATSMAHSMANSVASAVVNMELSWSRVV
jgi:hypothetical protein